MTVLEGSILSPNNQIWIPYLDLMKYPTKYVWRKNWTIDDYRNEVTERSIEDHRAMKDHPNLEKPCRLWTGATTRGSNGPGYGIYKVLGEVVASRVSYRIFHLNGDAIPDGLLVCHHCDVKSCVEPSHLFLGTFADNMQDMMNKGRAPRGPKHNAKSKAKIARAAKRRWSKWRKANGRSEPSETLPEPSQVQ